MVAVFLGGGLGSHKGFKGEDRWFRGFLKLLFFGGEGLVNCLVRGGGVEGEGGREFQIVRLPCAKTALLCEVFFFRFS